MQQKRQVRRQELGAHVAAGRSFGLAVELQRQDAGGAAADCDEADAVLLREQDGTATAYRLPQIAARAGGGAVDRSIQEAASRDQTGVPSRHEQGEQQRCREETGRGDPVGAPAVRQTDERDESEQERGR